MTDKMIKDIRDWIDTIQSPKIPVRIKENNKIKGTILLKNITRLQDFEKAFPQFKSVRKDLYIDETTEKEWRLLVANGFFCGHRFYETIIDSTIDEDIMRYQILPCLTGYCYSIKFF